MVILQKTNILLSSLRYSEPAIDQSYKSTNQNIPQILLTEPATLIKNSHLLRVQVRKVHGEHRSDCHVRRTEQQTENRRHPRLERHHGVREEHHEHHLPRALGGHPQRLPGVDGQREGAEGRQEEEHGVAHLKTK